MPATRISTLLPAALMAAAATQTQADAPCFTPANSSVTASGGPVTDGGKLRLHALQPIDFAPVLEGAGYFLSGYRYNNAPPSAGQPEGGGKERIHRSCHRIGPPLPDQPGVYELTLGRGMPSGDYFLGVVASCPAEPEIEDDVCEDTHNFLLAPSYLIATLDRVDVISNSEEEGDHPAEMRFQFASFSGMQRISGDATKPKVSIVGNYPAGPSGSGHLTHADGSMIRPNLPIFVGAQKDMFLQECIEEADALPDTQAENAADRCRTSDSQGEFTDHYQWAVNAVEFDENNADVWGKVAGAAAVGISCVVGFSGGVTLAAAGECAGGALTLGGKVSAAVESALGADDDKLGTIDVATHLGQNEFQFPLTGPEGDGPHLFTDGGDRLQGFVRAQETGGLMLLDYEVELKKIDILESYELFSGCEDPPEIYAIARGYAFDKASLPDGTRHPAGSEVFGLPIDFFIGPTVVKSNHPAGTAVETPGVYIEISVWERDGDRDADLMGILSEFFTWQNLFSADGFDEPTLSNMVRIDRVTPEGFPALEIRATFIDRSLRGFVGSDRHCVNITNNADLALLAAQDPNGRQGHVAVTYEVRATWLKSVGR